MGNFIAGCGLYLPKKCLKNSDLVNSLQDTSDEWITSRTGITQRYIALDDEYSSHLAFHAANEAIADAKISKNEIDLVIVCTTTPDNSFPSTATKLQGYLGLSNTPSFDLQATCAGFVYGIEVVDSLMLSGKYDTILLVGVDKMSSIVDWTDRSTAILFGDGAGAVILKKSSKNYGIIGSKIYSDGLLKDILYTDGGVSSNKKAGVIKMLGREVFRHAVEKMSSAALELIETSNITLNDISYVIPHQANLRIIEAVTKNLNIDQSKVVKTVDKHANCSAASIPMALHSLKQSGTIKDGDIILTIAIGAGLTWGSNLIRWHQNDNIN